MTNLIESVFVRPKMYSLTGSYGEVIAFLTGYYSGVAKGQPELKETTWTSFCIWLSKHLGVPISKEFDALYEKYHDRAFDALIRLYFEFKLSSSLTDDDV